MRDGDELVFVEVRARIGECGLESAIESVHFGKLLKLKRAIEFYLLKRQAILSEHGVTSLRLDILGFDGESWVWIRNQAL